MNDQFHEIVSPPKIVRLPWVKGTIAADSSDEIKDKFSGPISGPLWRKVSELNSSYPDTFDWAVYDRLQARFASSPPRGGVLFKTTFKLVNHHSTCSKCHYAFEVDTYGRGCVQNCVYCYAKEKLERHGYWNRPIPFPIDLSEIRKVFFEVFETDKPNKWRSVLEKRIPLRIGSMSEPFMWMDLKYGVTKEFLRILNFYRYPNIIFTRSDLAANDEYISLLDSEISCIQFSISGNNDALTTLLEPGAPSVKRRLKAIKRLTDSGIWTTVRINPLFPTFPDGYFTDPARISKDFKSLDKVPQFPLLDIQHIGPFLDELKGVGVASLLAGFVRLSNVAIAKISRSTKVPLRSFFYPDNYKPAGESHYSSAEIAYYYSVIQKESQKRGLRFSTCFIGNGLPDYYRYQKLWSNPSDCCDAKGNVSSFKKTSQDIAWVERAKFSPDKIKVVENEEYERNIEKEFEGSKGRKKKPSSFEIAPE
jgi:DNA repair photolyase